MNIIKTTLPFIISSFIFGNNNSSDFQYGELIQYYDPDINQHIYDRYVLHDGIPVKIDSAKKIPVSSIPYQNSCYNQFVYQQLYTQQYIPESPSFHVGIRRSTDNGTCLHTQYERFRARELENQANRTY